MAKFAFGAPPKTITRTVSFKTLDGVSQSIAVVFRYRNREELAALNEESAAIVKCPDDRMVADKDGNLTDGRTVTEIVEAVLKANTLFLMKALESWELSDALNEANVRRLCNEYPSACAAITEAYSNACRDGKLGN